MVNHTCPHCGAGGISALQKMFLGAALPMACSECGGKVGVPYVRSMLALAPWFVALWVLLAMSDGDLQSFFLGATGAAGLFIVSWAFVPLIRR